MTVRPDRHFDVVFADTCLGGSTVAARVGASAAGLRGYYLADYAVNPLGIKPPAEVHGALERWIEAAAARAGILVVACNTASVRLEEAPHLIESATGAGLRVFSMVQLLDRALQLAASHIRGKRVCIMGTRFTVSQPGYRDRVLRAGAAEVLPLAATRTERTIAHFWHESAEGRREIEAEVGETIRRSEAVVLACTLFPLIAALLREIAPACLLVDPAAGVDGDLLGITGPGPNRLTVALTGDALALEDVRARAPTLFPGWAIEAVEKAPLPGVKLDVPGCAAKTRAAV